MEVEKRELKSIQLLDLPHEILDLIFKQIPHEYLNRIKDIEQIKPYVLSRLYSSIVIGDSENPLVRMEDYYQKMYYDEIIQGYYVTEFETVESFVLIINRYELTKPKEIWVHGINFFIELYDHYPEIFSAAKISIISKEEYLKNQDCQKLKNIPCNFDEFANVIYCMAEDPGITIGYLSGGIEWMCRFKGITLSIRWFDKEYIHQPFFLNLTDLRIFELVPEDAKYISRNLKRLEVGVVSSDEQGPFLDLPHTLESLCISYFYDYHLRQLELDCNFTYLTNLKDLTIEILEFRGRVNYEFPSSLVTFKSESNYCSLIKDVISVYPNLSSICCPYLRLSNNDKNGDPFRFSYKLKKLKVSYEFLMETAIEKYDNMYKLPSRIPIEDILSESLQSLTLN